MTEAGKFLVRVDNNLLYRAPDGREAWVIFQPEKGLVVVVTDIHGNGQPENAVGFSATALRLLADRLDQLSSAGSA